MPAQTGLLVSLVFCFALLHQITVFARHRVRFEPLLADFASTGVHAGDSLTALRLRCSRSEQRACDRYGVGK
jgi:hypothetical protein